MVSEHSASSLFDVNKLRSKVLPIVRPCQIDPCLLIVDEEHTSSADEFPALIDPVAKAGGPLTNHGQRKTFCRSGAVDHHGLSICPAGHNFA